jgi:hypothetical protein
VVIDHMNMHYCCAHARRTSKKWNEVLDSCTRFARPPLKVVHA